MKLSWVMLACSCLIVIVSTWRHNANAAGVGIPGYLDAQTGEFKPLTPADEELAAVPSMTTGQVKVSFTVTLLNPAIPTNDAVSCNATASAVDAGSGHVFTESATVEATRAGSKATCTVTVPYSWPLVTPGSDSMIIAYVLSTPVTATAGPGPGALLNRLGSGTIATIRVPANGTTTSENVTASF